MFLGISGKGSIEDGVLQWHWGSLLRHPIQNLLCSWFSISGGSTPIFFWGKPNWPAIMESPEGKEEE